jgi:hypothetical protein
MPILRARMPILGAAAADWADPDWLHAKSVSYAVGLVRH